MTQDTNVIVEVSEILGSFDLEEINEMIASQISSDDNNDNFGNIIIDHFRPLWYKYKEVMKSGDDDIKQEAESRFNEICNTFINAIADKYNISVNSEWVNTNDKNLCAITIALYSFFIIDIKMNLCYTLYNYIITNIDDLNTTFEAARNKRDAATNSFRKFIKPEYYTIIANIYDVTQWILDNIDGDQFFDYMDQDYFPLTLLRSAYANGNMSGDFVIKIQEMYKSSINMRSIVCYDIMEKLNKNFHIPEDERLKGVFKED